MSAISSYPLQWPADWPHTEKKLKSSFRTGLAGALKNVRESLTAFSKDSGKAVTHVVISSNVSLGIPNPNDTGVAVWFTWEDAQLCIAVDRYEKVEENLQAIHHVIEARRTELRHGGLHLIRQTFKGFRPKALPPGNRNCWAVLGIPEGSSKDQIEKAYKQKAIKAHPDLATHQENAQAFFAANGSEEKMIELNAAKQEALKGL